MKNGKLIKLLLIVLPVAAVVLTALPNAVVMHFMGDPSVDGMFTKYVSGFDLLVLGYGNWGPMLAGVLSGVLACLGIVYAVKSAHGLYKAMRIITVIALVMSLVSLLFNEMTVIGGCISAVLLAEVLLCSMKKDA